jgi:hypothetical protein
MKACITCGHYSPHTYTGIQLCFMPDCGCTGPVTYETEGRKTSLWKISKRDSYWRVLRRVFSSTLYEEVGHYRTHDEALTAVRCFLVDDPFDTITRRLN